MSQFVTVAKRGDIPDGEGRSFQINGRAVALFRRGDVYTAIDDICSHMGASLAGGSIEDGGVLCPWHAWRFSITDGTWLDNPTSGLKQDVFEVRIEGDEIQVHVPSRYS
jgi:nitrite reductase (NADH) small subunit/3-phenylpropionate/trans-cinnamate dioxygenase ferredoxin subunit